MTFSPPTVPPAGAPGASGRAGSGRAASGPTAAASTTTAPGPAVLTPTVRQGTRRVSFWLVAALFVALVATGALLLVGASDDTTPLSPTSPAPGGTMAVAEVLRERGIDVVVTGSLAETEEAASTNRGSATVLVHDIDDMLEAEQLEALPDLADDLVVIDPSFGMLQALAPGVSAAGTPDDDPLAVSPEASACVLGTTELEGEVSPGGSSYRFTPGPGALAEPDADVGESSSRISLCLASDSDDADDAYSLVRIDTVAGAGGADTDAGTGANSDSGADSGTDTGTDTGTSVTIVGATDALTNGAIADRDNAAFALTLLGANDTLVWYLPSAADVDGPPTPGELTPDWLTPAILLLTATVLAAAFWRGRRFGPLVIENLPVVVRASETMEGRARLYQRGSARLHALDALRIGTIARLATVCGLPPSAGVDTVVAAVAALVASDRTAIRGLLVDGVPRTDADLVRLSDELLALEARVDAAARP
ncbi:DUF4350 domain-containing protein [Marisediminicola senii]|uniref:DUF4350 domain-containing protein n=1 Tax=Marisediminicola senii TaxID=2711233 RepID=UPI0013EBB8B4|nr:DUF4350 domain-containing protein [Marisediminicola senii]